MKWTNLDSRRWTAAHSVPSLVHKCFSSSTLAPCPRLFCSSCLDQVLSLLILILLACLSRDFGSLSASPVPSRPLIGCCWPPVQEPPNFTLLCQLHNCGSHLHCSTGFQLEQSKKEADRLYPIITMSSSRRPHSPFFVPTFLSFDHRSTI